MSKIQAFFVQNKEESIEGIIIMDNNTVTIMNEEFENDKTGEKVQGITIIIDGKLKEVVDLLMKNNPNYKNYTEIVRDAFFKGINSMIVEQKNSL